jgi:hypothetical protein
MTRPIAIVPTLPGVLLWVAAPTIIHRAADGELFLSSRQDGCIRTLAAADPPARPSARR